MDPPGKLWYIPEFPYRALIDPFKEPFKEPLGYSGLRSRGQSNPGPRTSNSKVQRTP